MRLAPRSAARAVMLVAFVSFRAQPYKREEVLSVIDDMVTTMRHASGCTRARLLMDTEDANSFTIESEWQTPESAEEFFDSRVFQLFRGIRILLRDEPLIVLDDIRSRTTRLIRGR